MHNFFSVNLSSKLSKNVKIVQQSKNIKLSEKKIIKN